MTDLEGVCDTHMHFYDDRYPTDAGARLFPPAATPHDYEVVQAELGIERTVVVQPTTYGFDNQCQLDGMAVLASRSGDTTVRGVAVVSAQTLRSELDALHMLGIRGARFHMLPGGAVGWDHLEPVAAAIAPLGWHIQLQLDGNELIDRFETLGNLAVPLVVDHVGRFMPPPSPTSRQFGALVDLVDAGTMVKLSAPYESSDVGPPDYPDVFSLAKLLINRNPERLLWATNWPHPGQPSPPTVADLAELRKQWLPTADLQQQVLVTNPARLYDFP